tara:strand:+ start:349 stop:585 length:237 start_codon:yes stop_codon:yes gene_type:complete
LKILVKIDGPLGCDGIGCGAGFTTGSTGAGIGELGVVLGASNGGGGAADFGRLTGGGGGISFGGGGIVGVEFATPLGS